mmetsp:Transcript_30703/g.61500  ORF Transcript_30703/g.61500 Transcript_30703/m.61500 type:complete len:617 (+) Transcript_30703:1631-3481(+)
MRDLMAMDAMPGNTNNRSDYDHSPHAPPTPSTPSTCDIASNVATQHPPLSTPHTGTASNLPPHYLPTLTVTPNPNVLSTLNENQPSKTSISVNAESSSSLQGPPNQHHNTSFGPSSQSRHLRSQTLSHFSLSSSNIPRNESVSMNFNNFNNPYHTNCQNYPNTNIMTQQRERLGGYLHPRDMRRLVTPFSSSNEPSLIIRRHVMLLNFDPLRAIVLRDRVLVLVPDGADSILIELEKRVRGGITEMENQVFGYTDGGSGGRRATSTPNEVFSTPAKTGIHNNEDKSSRTLSSQEGAEGIKDSYNGVYKPVESMMKKAKDMVHQMSSATDDEGASDTNSNATPALNKSVSVQDDSNPSQNDIANDNEWEDMQKMNWNQMSFELQSLDAVLQTVTTMLMEDARKTNQRAVKAMSDLRGEAHNRRGRSLGGAGPGEHAQERLRLHKDEVKLMEGRVQGFVRAMNEVLDDDEDMTLMNLSRLLTHPERFIQPVSQEILHEESDEPELILEAYLQQALSIVNELDILKGQIMTTEEQINMTLDAIRNRLLYINTLLSVASLCVAMGSFIGSLFGMNLTNPLEDDGGAFMRVILWTVVSMVGLWAILSWIFYEAANLSPSKS